MFFVLHDRYLVLHIIEYIESNMKNKLKINIENTLVKDVFMRSEIEKRDAIQFLSAQKVSVLEGEIRARDFSSTKMLRHSAAHTLFKMHN
jgi:hypothetical protein